jgi:NAD+ kinase
MKIAIYSRGIEHVDYDNFKELLEELYNHEVEPVFHTDLFNQIYTALTLKKYSTFSSYADLNEDIHCLISLGGDGTLLDTVALVRDKGIPIIGINYGRLGFLANIGKPDVSKAVKALVNGTYLIDKRTLVHLASDIALFDGVNYALNEFTIHKRDTSPMIKIHTYLNGDFLNTYWADGLIIATPTGSTGYSVSCNGPIVFPDSGTFIITPVSPHNLNIRPVVIPDNTIITFEVEARAEDFIVSLDSRRAVVPKEIQLAIKRESFQLKLIRLNENNFFETLRQKLSWGLDKRN